MFSPHRPHIAFRGEPAVRAVFLRLQNPRSHKLAGNELLPAVDVVGRAREGRVYHDVYGERGDVGRSDDAPDGKRGAKLIAAVFEFVAEERRRQPVCRRSRRR
jgi:hypothetical protein